MTLECKNCNPLKKFKWKISKASNFKNDTACLLFVSHKEKKAFHYLPSLTLQSV